MTANEYHDLPELDEGEAEELESGDELEESEETESPFRSLSEYEAEEGRLLGERIDTEDDEDDGQG